MHPAEIKLVAEVDRDLTEMDRRVAALEIAIFGRSGKLFPEQVTKRGGWCIGKVGRMEFVVDPITHRAVSKGYESLDLYGCGNHAGLTISEDWEKFFVHPVFRVED